LEELIICKELKNSKLEGLHQN